MDTYISSNRISTGKQITPIQHIQLFSPAEWEEFIEEWLDILKDEKSYIEIERLGGAGDQGRDVVAYVSEVDEEGQYIWDCYQCKHYDHSLIPTDIYVELGKIIYYSKKKEYPVPRNYYFVAPKGCGSKLSGWLKNTDELKANFKKAWSNYCENNITTKESIPLDEDMQKYIDDFDFGIFKKSLVKDIISQHTKHSNHILRFGGGLPPREHLDLSSIPAALQPNENRYVSQLLKAYKSECNIEYKLPSELESGSRYDNHFKRARISFHHAEQLRNFFRDALPARTFEDFQDEILSGVINIAEDSYDNNFLRVKAVEQEATKVTISSNPYKDVSIVDDKKGVCHQLSNDGKLTWHEDE